MKSHKRHLTVWGIALCRLFAVWGAGFAEYRFPKPEFTGDYSQPVPTAPPAAFASQPLFALIVLCVVMGLTGFLLYRVRSRVWLRLVVIASLLYFGFYHGGCVCAVGSVQNVVQALFNGGTYVPWAVVATFVLPLLAALFFGRVFCGAACPLGAIQELMIVRPVRVPHMLDAVLRLFPYVYLGLAVVFAACNIDYLVCRYDPFVGLFRFSGPLAMLMAGGGLLILGTVVARPYCRYICPYSVLLRFMSRFSARRVSVTPDECVVCHLCSDACPVDAIQSPRPHRFAESRERALSRMRWIAAFTPLLLLVGILTGLALYGPVKRMHPEIQTANELRAMKDSVVKERDIYNRNISDAEAFLEKGGNPDDLMLSAAAAGRRLKIALALFGAYLALVFIGALVKTTRRRTNTDYVVDSADCVACARCYQYCPRQNKRENRIL